MYEEVDQKDVNAEEFNTTQANLLDSDSPQINDETSFIHFNELYTSAWVKIFFYSVDLNI